MPAMQLIEYLTLKSEVKVIAKVKMDDHIWDLMCNRYVCSQCRAQGTIVTEI